MSKKPQAARYVVGIDLGTTNSALAYAEIQVDAVIVQDLGLVRLIRSTCPGLAVHGSTQMTLTEPRGIEFVRSLGVSRVILAREDTVEPPQLAVRGDPHRQGGFAAREARRNLGHRDGARQHLFDERCGHHRAHRPVDLDLDLRFHHGILRACHRHK